MGLFDAGELLDGLLAVRLTLNGGQEGMVALEGELDHSNADVAGAGLREAVEKLEGPIVVDMRELSFIDSTGIALLVALLQEDDGAERLRFLASESRAVRRVLSITGVDERLKPAETPLSEQAGGPVRDGVDGDGGLQAETREPRS